MNQITTTKAKAWAQRYRTMGLTTTEQNELLREINQRLQSTVYTAEEIIFMRQSEQLGGAHWLDKNKPQKTIEMAYELELHFRKTRKSLCDELRRSQSLYHLSPLDALNVTREVNLIKKQQEEDEKEVASLHDKYKEEIQECNNAFAAERRRNAPIATPITDQTIQDGIENVQRNVSVPIHVDFNVSSMYETDYNPGVA